MEHYIKLTRRLPIARIRHFMCCNSQACAGDRSFNIRRISTCGCSPRRALAVRNGPSVCLLQSRTPSHVGLCRRTVDGRQAFSTLSVTPRRLSDPTTYDVTGGSGAHKERTLLNACDGTLSLSLVCTSTTNMTVRKKSTNSKGKSRTQAVRDEEDDDDESDDESDTESDNIFFEEDSDFPTNFRDIKVYMKSLRLDGVVSSGLNIARNKVDEYFLGSKLRMNGMKVLKKSKQMNVGDHVDLVASSEDGKLKVKRVRVVKVESQKSNKDKLSVHLRVWRNNVSIEDPDKFQPHSHSRS